MIMRKTSKDEHPFFMENWNARTDRFSGDLAQHVAFNSSGNRCTAKDYKLAFKPFCSFTLRN